MSLLYTQQQLLDKIDELAKTNSDITFYCSDLNNFYPLGNFDSLNSKLMIKLFAFKKQDKNVNNVNIVTNYYINKKNLFDEKADKEYIIDKAQSIKIPVKRVGVDGLLENFSKELIEATRKVETKIKQSKDNINNKTDTQEYDPLNYQGDIKSFVQAVNFITNNFRNDKYRNEFLEPFDKLRDSLKKRTAKILEKEQFEAPKVYENIDDAFNEIKNNLRNVSWDAYIIKEIIAFILGLVDITNPKKLMGKLFAAPIVYDALKRGLSIYEYAQTKGYYTFISPTLRLLSKDFGFIFNHINITSICNILVFKNEAGSKDGHFIDFSGFDEFGSNLSQGDIDLNLDEYMGVYGEIEGDIDIFAYNKSKNYSASDIDYIYESINKNFGSSISEQDSLFGKVKNSIIRSDASFIYIQAPYFNSLKFANLISGKTNDDSKNCQKISGINKNYLVISNAPLKQNAGLSNYIIETALEQKIDDDINRTYSSSIIDMNHKDTKYTSPLKDYSHYSIDTKAKDEKDAYILSLSPFARVDKNVIDKFNSDIQKVTDGTAGRYNEEQEFINILDQADIASKNLAHINLYAKQPEEIEEIKSKEQSFLEESIDKFKSFFESISDRWVTVVKFKDIDEPVIQKGLSKNEMYPNEDDNEDILDKTYEYIENMQLPYSIIDIFLMATSFYIIKQMYDSNTIKINDKNFIERIIDSDDERISIDGTKFIVLRADSKMNDDTPVYFFKENIQNKKQEYICIEEIADKFADYSVSDKEKIFGFSSIEEFRLYCEKELENIGDDKEYDSIRQGLKRQNEEIKKEQEELTKNINKLNGPGNAADKFVDDALKSITDDILKTLCPFASYIKEEKYEELIKSMAEVMFGEKKFADTFMSEIGILNAFKTLNIPNDKIHIRISLAANDKNKKQILLNSKRLGRFSFFNLLLVRSYRIRYDITKASSTNIDKFGKAEKINKFMAALVRFDMFKHQVTTFLKENLSLRTLKIMGISALVEAYMTEYEKLRKEYETILYKRFKYKYNYPYALTNISPMPINHEDYHTSKTKALEYTYYPITIYSSSISVNLKDMFIGGRFCTGGLDYHSFMFYEIDSTGYPLYDAMPRSPLKKLATYLCLDELRTVYYDDPSYFRNALRDDNIRIRLLDLIDYGDKKANDEHKEIYEAYKNSVTLSNDGDTQIPIAYYQEAMQILKDLHNGYYRTYNEDKVSRDDKTRRLMKALDIIGNNNVKGMYVGCKEYYTKGIKGISKEDIPPRIIGRLATTVIMEDGLFLG